MTVVLDPSTSPNLAECDFFLPITKADNIITIQEQSQAALAELKTYDFCECFLQWCPCWIHHSMTQGKSMEQRVNAVIKKNPGNYFITSKYTIMHKERKHSPGNDILAVDQCIWGCRETATGSDVNNMQVLEDGEEHEAGLRTATQVQGIKHIM
jgi:hypothetical protein